MGYGPSYKNGEWWSSEEVYQKRLLAGRKQTARYYAENKEEVLAKNRKWRESLSGREWQEAYEAGRTKIKADQSRHRYQNDPEVRERIKLRNREWNKTSSATKYYRRRQSTEERKEYVRKNRRERIKQDPLYLLRHRVANRVRRALGNLGLKKSKTIQEYCGCSPDLLRKFIAAQLPKGRNMEGVHIDHFFPISMATNERDLLIYSHFSNLRPISAQENLIKGGTPPEPDEIMERSRLVEGILAQMGGAPTAPMQE